MPPRSRNSYDRLLKTAQAASTADAPQAVRRNLAGSNSISYLRPVEDAVTSWQALDHIVPTFPQGARPKAEADQAAAALAKLYKTLDKDARADQGKILENRPSFVLGNLVQEPTLCFIKDADLRAQHKNFQQTVLGQQIRIFMGLIRGDVASQMNLKAVAMMYADQGKMTQFRSARRSPGLYDADALYAKDECLISQQDLYAARDMALCAAVASGGIQFARFGKDASLDANLDQAAAKGQKILENEVRSQMFKAMRPARPIKQPRATV